MTDCNCFWSALVELTAFCVGLVTNDDADCMVVVVLDRSAVTLALAFTAALADGAANNSCCTSVGIAWPSASFNCDKFLTLLFNCDTMSVFNCDVVALTKLPAA